MPAATEAVSFGKSNSPVLLPQLVAMQALVLGSAVTTLSLVRLEKFSLLSALPHLVLLAICIFCAGLLNRYRLSAIWSNHAIPRARLAIISAAIGLGLLGAIFVFTAQELSPEAIKWICASTVVAGAFAFWRWIWSAATYLVAFIGSSLIADGTSDLLAISGAAAFAIVCCLIVSAQSVELDLRTSLASYWRTRASTSEGLIISFEQSRNHWLWTTDVENRITYISPWIEKTLGFDISASKAFSLADLFTNFVKSEDKYSALQSLKFYTVANMPFSDVTLPLSVGQEDRWFSVSGGVLKDKNGQFCGYSGIGIDLTVSRQAEENARQLALYDSLTGLANRSHFHNLLNKLLGRSLNVHSACTLMFIDLDRFKMVNDTLGHPVGDELLREVARRIEHIMGDHGHAGRLGGDEFVVAIPNVLDRTTLSGLATRLIAEISAPYHIDRSNIQIGASIGLATGPHDGQTSDELVQRADLALYAAKASGRGSFRFYEAKMGDAVNSRNSLELDLREALAKGEFELFYQPIFDLRSDGLSGFEALLRWTHPIRGKVPPEHFIPIAEESGLIAPIGEWVVLTALDQASRWPAHLKIAVNLSPIQLQDPALAGMIINSLGQTQIDPRRIELEVTESVFLQNTPTIKENMDRLRSVGLGFALDDFGTGYSSLGYLQKGAFSKIKIDRSFVQGVETHNSGNNSIVRAVVALARSLDMITTAEGAETQKQVNALKEIGCSQVQGFACSEPLSADAAMELAFTPMSTAEKRLLEERQPRLTMLKKILIDAKDRRSVAVLKNLSPNGAMLDSDFPIALGSQVRLVIPELENPVGTVRWTKGLRCGLEFEQTIDMEHLKYSRTPNLEQLSVFQK